MPAPHPPEFRRRAVDLARAGDKPVSAIAKELSISKSCLRNWMAQADADDTGISEPRLTSAEKRELTELRREKRCLEAENDFQARGLGLNPSAQQCFESISWGVEIEGLAGAGVEPVGDLIELGLGDVTEAGCAAARYIKFCDERVLPAAVPD